MYTPLIDPSSGHHQQAYDSSTASSKVQLFISCRNLKDVDIISVSDPQVIIYTRANPRDGWMKLDQTEVMKNNLNPNFEKSFIVSYYFERHQYFKFDVVDSNNIGGNLDAIGSVETTLGNIVGAKQQTFIGELQKQGTSSKRGTIYVRADSVKESNMDVALQVSARNLPSTSSCLCATTNNIFFEIYRGSASGQFLKVYDSDPIAQTVNPVYPSFKLKGQQLCNSDKNLPIKFMFTNQVTAADKQPLCSVTVTLQQLMDKREWALSHVVTGQPAGTIVFSQIQIIEKPTFVEYLRSGWQINLCVAIDYTGSNGEYSSPQSLHYLGAHNQYESAILNVGSILEPYDNNRSFPVYGFGGIPRFMGLNQVSHCFPLNGNASNPEVLGTQGVMHLYRQTLQGINLSGPTYFGGVIQQMMSIVKSQGGPGFYNILLIITDGEIHDMQKTKDLVVQCSHLPLSIIIVGVGLEKFKLMKELDSDKQLLRDSHGQQAARDVVQFVKFKKYIQQGPERLAEQVLKEVPDQFVNYMMNNRIMPNPQAYAKY
ncbi:hypothetical protein FGO68_gene6821 [Halteria grandinella]|uniref:Copine family protein n=1 Tax=Halteria grandinella TaxID=5974 RepID=A0A8J8T2Q3_HALGN|nr:hypothetical protein FGO68_gene6821 [Halteria grandinella]